MEASIFKLVSIGRVAQNKERASRHVEVLLLETATGTDGEITFDPHEITLEGQDANGSQYNVKTTSTRTVNCEWLPNEDNRVTPPDLRRNEIVEVWRLGDTDQYYWRSMAFRNNLRTLESVVFAWNATRTPAGGGIDFANCYFMAVSAHDKHWTIGTSKANGEPFAYTFQINTDYGAVYIKDDVGQLIELDTRNKRLQLKNADNSYVKVERGMIDLFANAHIKMTVGGTSMLLTPDSITSNTVTTSMTSSGTHTTTAGNIIEATGRWDII